MNLLPGDVILSHDIGSELHKFISLVSGSYWSHASLYLGDDILIESDRDGVGLKKCSDEIKKCDFKIIRFPYLKKEQKEKLFQSAQTFLGYQYDYGGMLFKMKNNFSTKAQYNVHRRNEISCAALIIEIYRKIGIDILPNVTTPIPKDLLLSKHLIEVY